MCISQLKSAAAADYDDDGQLKGSKDCNQQRATPRRATAQLGHLGWGPKSRWPKGCGILSGGGDRGWCWIVYWILVVAQKSKGTGSYVLMSRKSRKPTVG